MRVTERHRFSTLAERMNTGVHRFGEAVDELSSGQRIDRPSDDSDLAARIQRLEQSQARYRAHIEVNERVAGELDAVDDALISANDIAVRLRELVAQMTSGAKTSASFQAAAEEMQELREAMLSVSNSQYRDRYLFAGVVDGSPPFADDGSFLGSVEVREWEILDRTTVEQVSGAEVFGAAGTGVDIFAIIDDVQAALTAEDQDALNLTLTPLRDFIGQLAATRQQIGDKELVLDQAHAFAESAVLSGSERLSELADTDFAEAASRMQLNQVVLQAVAESASRWNDVSKLIFKL